MEDLLEITVRPHTLVPRDPAVHSRGNKIWISLWKKSISTFLLDLVEMNKLWIHEPIGEQDLDIIVREALRRDTLILSCPSGSTVSAAIALALQDHLNRPVAVRWWWKILPDPQIYRDLASYIKRNRGRHP